MYAAKRPGKSLSKSMKIVERKDCHLISDVFPDHIICGFTKKHIDGIYPEKDFSTLKPFFPDMRGLAYLKQVHSSTVCLIEQPGLYAGDGLCSAKEEIMLMVKTADCLPLFFYQETHDIMAMVHLGWRPAAEGILGNVNLDMKRILVTAGVGLRRCCYGVGDEVRNLSKLSPCTERRNGRFYFDPIGFVKRQLLPRGLKEENFFDTNICSFCDTRFHSYRQDRTEKRTLSFMMKKVSISS